MILRPRYSNLVTRKKVIDELVSYADEAALYCSQLTLTAKGKLFLGYLAHLLGLDLNAPIRVEFKMRLTKDAIKEAFKNPRKIDMDLVDVATSTSYFRPSCGLYFISYFMEKSEKGTQCRACSKYRCEINH